MKAVPGSFILAAVLLLTTVCAAFFWQLWWLPLAPVFLFAIVWAFEKPELFFYALLATIPWSIEYQFSSRLGTDFPDEPLMWINSLLAIVLLITRFNTLLHLFQKQPLLWLLLLQLVWAALAIIPSTQPLLSVKFLLAKCWYLSAFVIVPVLLLDTKQKISIAAAVLATSMAVVMLLTMVRHAFNGFSFATINQSLEPFFRNHVNYSALLLCVLPLLFVFSKRTSSRSLKKGLQLVCVIGVAALYFSFARGAWLALAVGLVGYGLLKKKALLSAFLFFILITVSAVCWLQHDNQYLRYSNNYNQTIFHTNFSEHLIATYQLKDLSTAERFYRWVAGVRMAGTRWQTGFGPSTFYSNYKSYTIPLFKTWVSANEEHSTVHNYFLLLLIEQGVFGLLLFLALLFVAFYKLQMLYHATTDPFWKGALAVIAVIIVMICTVNFLSDLIETDKIGSLFYTCLAVLMLAEKNIRAEGSNLAAHVQRIA